MMSMSVPYELTGRVQQKARTRDALVTAARKLLTDGATPTVEQAADAAQVARATAYRYFPNQSALLAATYPEIGEPSLVGARGLTDPAARLDAVSESLTRQIVEHEPELRTMLRLSLDPDPAKRGDLPLRQGRRITWVADALEPLRDEIPAQELDRITISIAAALGIEALVWLTDIAKLSREEAQTVMRWSARAMLESARAERGARS
jgi:AcrR family transcriptional regulator